MELRQWLFIAGTVIIIYVVVDAIRRARQAKKDELSIARQMEGEGLQGSPLDGDFNPELPAGGFRVLRRNEAAEVVPSAPLDEALPVEAGLHADAPEDTWGAAEETGLKAEGTPGGEVETKPYRTIQRPTVEDKNPRFDKTALLDDEFKSRFLKRITPIQPAKQKKSEEPKGGAKKEETIIVNVVSRSEEGFQGQQLRKLVEACGMEMGKRQFFDRHEYGPNDGPVQFSMANGVASGEFPDDLERAGIAGVYFFMQLPGPEDSMNAYECMIGTAQCLANNLGGEMRDERQSVMTGQTIEHGRQRVREFERKQLSVRG